jgi:DNA-binding transcriptional ArsR family regulator
MFTIKQTDRIFHALAHASRRKMLDVLKNNPGCLVGELSRHFDVSRIAVMNHLNVLEQAGLVMSKKSGRSRHLYLNLVPIQMIYERWGDEYGAFWSGKMLSIKMAAEAKGRSKQRTENDG